MRIYNKVGDTDKIKQWQKDFLKFKKTTRKKFREIYSAHYMYFLIPILTRLNRIEFDLRDAPSFYEYYMINSISDMQSHGMGEFDIRYWILRNPN